MMTKFHVGVFSAMLGVLVFHVDSAVAGERDESETVSGADSEQEAVALFQESVEHYRAGRFRQAVDLLKQAYALRAEPVLLYNLARAHEGLGELKEAIRAYERFLEQAPDSKDRGAIEKRIETLQNQVAERRRLEEEKRRAEQQRERRLQEASLPPPKQSEPSVAPWIVASVGGALLANGLVFGVMSNQRESAANDEAIAIDAKSRLDEAQTFATVANVSFAAGGSLGLAGLIWAWLDQPASETPSSATAPRVRFARHRVTLSIMF